MAYNSDLLSVSSNQLSVGLSGIIGLTLVAGQVALTVKNLGGGTLFMGGATLAVGGANGYPMALSEVLSLDLRATVYFASNGATTTVAFIRGGSEGI